MELVYFNERTEVTKSGTFWVHFSAGDNLPLSDNFELNFDEDCYLPVLLAGDDRQRYNEAGKVAVTPHTILMGILLGYEEIIPGEQESVSNSKVLSGAIRKLVTEYFGKDDTALFLLGAAHWLRENEGLWFGRKAVWTAMQLEPFAASIRNDYIGITWQMAESETTPKALNRLLQELVDAYCHQFLNEVRPDNLEMSSYFFCCSLGLLQLTGQPAEHEWYKCALRNIKDEDLLGKLNESETSGFSIQLCSLNLSCSAPEKTRMNYGPYWYALMGDNFHSFIETDLSNPDKLWNLVRQRQNGVGGPKENENPLVSCSDYPPNAPLRFVHISSQENSQDNHRTLSVYPYCAEGISNSLRIITYEKIDEHEGFVRTTALNSGATINFFDPLFMADEMCLVEGLPVNFILGALALRLGKASPCGLESIEDSMLKIERTCLLEEVPDANAYNIDSVKGLIAGSAACIHTRGRAFESEIRTTVTEVGWFSFEGQEMCRMRGTLISGEGDSPLEYLIYAAPHILNGYRPEPGDDVEGVVWLQGHLDRSARRMIEGREGLEGVEEAIQAVTKLPGLVYGLFDVLAESPSNPPALRTRCAYTLARLAQKNPAMLGGWNNILCNYKFSDEPVELDRQFAQLIPKLVLGDRYFIPALYTVYGLISSSDDVTRILALRGLMKMPSDIIVVHPIKLMGMIQEMTDGSGTVLDLVAQTALRSLRFLDESVASDLLLRSQLFYNGKLYEEALENIEKALEIDSDNEDIWNLRALIIFNGFDRGEDALKCLEHVTTTDGSAAGKQLFQGIIYYYSKEYETALSYFEKIIPEELSINRQFQLHVTKAMLLKQCGKAEEALALYLRGLELYESCDKLLPYVIYYRHEINEGLSKCASAEKEPIRSTVLPRDLTIVVGPPGPEEDKKMIAEAATRKGVKPEEMYVEYVHSLFKGTLKIADGETQSSFDKLLSTLVGRDVCVKDVFPSYTIMEGQLLPVFIIYTDNVLDVAGLPAQIDLGNKELRGLLPSLLGLSFRSEWIRTFVSYFDEKRDVQ